MSDSKTVTTQAGSPSNPPKDMEQPPPQYGEATKETEPTRPAAPERAKTGESRLSRAWTKRNLPRTDGKIELKEKEAWDKLGYSFPTWKKWLILTVIFTVQMSMNFNTSVFP